VRVIDFHTHLDDRWFAAPLMTPGTFIAGLNQCGIGPACVFTLMGFYEECGPHNDALARRAAAHPNRLFPFLTVDPKRGPAAVAEVERCIATRAFRGIKFHPWLQAFAPSMVRPTMVEILQLAAQHRLPVLFHDGTPPYSTTFQIANVARWVPDATIVLGHAGLADYTHAAADLARDLPNLYACACGPKPADIRHIVKTAGAHKVCFGSDFGLSDATILQERLDSVTHAGLTDDELDQVLYRTSASLLHLDP
jgi:predicted TIM-barrel fold metal-dependent hydrolase